MSAPTLFWHDYETWGANPVKDHPSQFAGIRTDLDLNIIGEPVNIYCQIPNDQLPHPQACLITGITPQLTLRDGLVESEFVKKVMAEFSVPNTCVVGYNNIRFDDEITRHTLFRNFHDPYAREWQNGNSRWDIIDMVRACFALRPEGIEWPLKEDGTPSFKLEDLCAANNLIHEDAHDAMSDVYATIAVAKMIKTKQPKLYDFLFNNRSKQKVMEQINWFEMTPLVHVSSRFPAQNGCCSWIVPIAQHPTNKNAIICVNLAGDPAPLLEMDSEQLLARLYTRSEDLAPGEERIPVKLIHINKCPVIAPAKTLSEENAKRLGIDREKCLNNLSKIQSYEGLQKKLQEMYDTEHESKAVDSDHSLYSGGFFSKHDKTLIEQVQQTSPEQLSHRKFAFEDKRLDTLLFRFRARNYPATLDDEELARWQRHREFVFLDSSSSASVKMPDYMQQIELLMHEYENDANKRAILNALVKYAENL